MALLDLLGPALDACGSSGSCATSALTSRALRTACDEASPTVLQARLSELREAGLVELSPGDGYRLTAAGQGADGELPAAASLCRAMEQAEAADLGRRHRQAGAVGLHDPDPAAGRRVGTGDAPDRVVDPHRAGAVDDRLFQREHPADQRLGAPVEKRVALAAAAWRCARSRRHSGTAATANTANISSCVCQDGLIANDSRPTSSAASPSQNMNTPGASSSSAIRMKPKISQFQVPSVVEHLGHDTSVTSRINRASPVPDRTRLSSPLAASPAAGSARCSAPRTRRAAACAEAALSPKVALAISPMPASEPSMRGRLDRQHDDLLVRRIRRAAPNALMYLSAMK